jgi:hypothetical protein
VPGRPPCPQSRVALMGVLPSERADVTVWDVTSRGTARKSHAGEAGRCGAESHHGGGVARGPTGRAGQCERDVTSRGTISGTSRGTIRASCAARGGRSQLVAGAARGIRFARADLPSHPRGWWPEPGGRSRGGRSQEGKAVLGICRRSREGPRGPLRRRDMGCRGVSGRRSG